MFEVILFMVGFSVEEDFLAKSSGFCTSWSGLGEDVAVGGFEVFSAFKASLVENIRVNRFVIEVLSGAFGLFCGSEGGAALPLRFSVLGLVMPY